MRFLLTSLQNQNPNLGKRVPGTDTHLGTRQSADPQKKGSRPHTPTFGHVSKKKNSDPPQMAIFGGPRLGRRKAHTHRKRRPRKLVAGIGALFGCFARKIDDPGLPGDLLIYQGNPSISNLKGHPCQGNQLASIQGEPGLWVPDSP